MEEHELLAIIRKGESSKVQFKERLPHIDSIAHEIVAFSNSRGGIIIFGVNDKTGALNGLSFTEIQEINQQLANAASQKVYPPIFLTTETLLVNNNHLLIASIEEGAAKPYKDSNGIIYVKNGADKRKVTSNDELARLLRSGGSLYAEEMIVQGSSTADINLEQFSIFIQRKYKQSFDDLGITADKLLENLNLAKNGCLTLSGLLLFSSKRHLLRPHFSVQCVSMDSAIIGNDFTDNEGVLEGALNGGIQQPDKMGNPL